MTSSRMHQWIGRAKHLLCLSGLWVCSEWNTSALRVVTGNISGEWRAEDGPFRVADNCVVPANQVLTIKPGTIIELGTATSIEVVGKLVAAGSTEARIRFSGGSAGVRWSHIRVTNGGEGEFKFCDFSGAQTGIMFSLDDVNVTKAVEVSNCNFSGISTVAIHCHVEGQGHASFGGSWANRPILLPSIYNCRFSDSAAGCVFIAVGNPGGVSWPGAAGTIRADIQGNIFEHIDGVGVEFAESLGAASTASVINNTFVKCKKGMVMSSAYSCKVSNNIWQGSEVACEKPTSLPCDLAFNCFYTNKINFSGFARTFGETKYVNRNGQPCDVALNIFVSPSFVDEQSLQLAPNSACIDAGLSDATYADQCFPPSLGTAESDLGAFGGKQACRWPLKNAVVQGTMVIRVSEVELDFATIQGAWYQLQFRSILTTNTWTPLSGWIVGTGHRYSTNDSVTDIERYYRVVTAKSHP